MFPEDYCLPRKKLLRLWIAEEFVEQKGGSTLEETAEGYLLELINRSMLPVVERNYSGKPANIDKSVRRLSIIKSDNNIGHDIQLPQLRTLMSFDISVLSSQFLTIGILKFRCLTMLSLEESNIDSIPDQIGDLFNLHYLGLRNTKVKLVPKSIKKLQNLQTLDLMDSEIQRLPDGIEELKKLRHLFAEKLVDPTYKSFQNRTGINLSKGIFYLKELQTIQALESNAMVVRELGNLTQLRSFRIWNAKENHSAELCRSLSKMNSLSCLSINASNKNEILHLEGLNLPQIQKLYIRGWLKEKMFESPLFQISVEGIQDLWLGWSQLQNNPLSSLSKCKNLTSLRLLGAYEGHQLTFQAKWFPELKKLLLRQMPNLVQAEMEQGTMVILEEIHHRELKQLADIPVGIEHLISLKWMGCDDMPDDFGGLAKGIHQLCHLTCGVF